MQGLFSPPLIDPGMVAALQNFGNLPAAKFCRLGVVRLFKQAHRVRVIFRAGGVAQHAGEEARDGVDQNHRG